VLLMHRPMCSWRSVFGNVRAMVADTLYPDAQATALGFISMAWGLGAVLGAAWPVAEP